MSCGVSFVAPIFTAPTSIKAVPAVLTVKDPQAARRPRVAKYTAVPGPGRGTDRNRKRFPCSAGLLPKHPGNLSGSKSSIDPRHRSHLSRHPYFACVSELIYINDTVWFG
jgi:hypothetical protein